MTKKILILIFSIVLFVIASEFVLRISGNLFYSWWMHEGARPLTFEESEIERINDKVRVSSPDKDLLRILCVGDSWTFGYGAAPYLS
ncbi:MAG: hypothetical protein KKC84_06025, partial [Candidatus Omnitrophica bacterium]|nr:hypothetical protein [Candidatus Omnitrophota bacterium]